MSARADGWRSNGGAVTTADLVRRAQNGDGDALACLLGEHRLLLSRFCVRLVGAGAAEDIAQETMLRAVGAIARLQDPERFSAWLLGITANLAKKWWERQARWPLSMEGLMATYPDMDWGAALSEGWNGAPDAVIERREQTDRLQQALGALPEPLGRVLALHYVEGLSYAEIAAALDVPVSTVRGRLAKSRTHLQRSLVEIGVLTPKRRRRPGQQVADASSVGKGQTNVDATSGEGRLVPVVVSSIRMQGKEPTAENVKEWLEQRWPPERREVSDPAVRPDLTLVAEELATTLAERNLRLPWPHRWVWLTDEAGGRRLYIQVGVPEADAMAVHLLKREMPRPMTHDLTLNMLGAAGLNVEQVAITRLEGTTYYATVTLRGARGRKRKVDARPRDAINLDLRAGAPIYVSEHLLQPADVTEGSAEQSETLAQS